MIPIAAAIGVILATTISYRAAFGVFAVICALLAIPYLRVMTAATVAGIDKPATAEDDTAAPAQTVPLTAGQ